MKTKAFLFICVTITFLSACQKDFSFEIPTTESIITSDSNLLKKYIELDTIGGIDTLTKTLYEYDNMRRLLSRKEKNYTDSFFNDRYYSYSGNDTLVSRMLEIYYSTSQTDVFYDSAFTYFIRNSNNKIIKDSSIIFSIDLGITSFIKLVSDFTYFAGDSIERSITIYDPVSSTNRFSFKQIRNGNNIIKESEYNFNGSPGSFTPNRIANFTYDNRYNPFYGEKINYPVTLNPNNYSDYFTPKNNLVLIDVSGFAEAVVYTYNTLGFPIKSVITFPGSSGYAIKGVFIYGN